MPSLFWNLEEETRSKLETNEDLSVLKNPTYLTATSGLSKGYLATGIIGGCLTLAFMFATFCCTFFWWQRLRLRKQVVVSPNQIVVPRIRSLPVVRGEDIISFVLPAQNGGEGKVQEDACPLRSSSPLFGNNNQTTNNRNIRSSTLNLADFNMLLYSPGQEVNEGIHTDKPKVGVSLQYDQLRNELQVKVLGALKLPNRNKKYPPDPYVKVTIDTDRQLRHVTRTLRANNNPLFNEVFTFNLSLEEMKTALLGLSVRDRHDLSRYVNYETENHPHHGHVSMKIKEAVSSTSEQLVSLTSRCVVLGNATLKLADLGLFPASQGENRRKVMWCLLEEPVATETIKNNETPKAEMLLSLCYEPDNGRMILEIAEVRHLHVSNQDKEKITIKLSLYERKSLISTQRTKAVRRSLNGPFHDKFIITILPKVLQEASCQLMLQSKSKIGTKKTIGRVTLGNRHFFPTNNTAISRTGLDHWHDMEHRPGVAISRWHELL